MARPAVVRSSRGRTRTCDPVINSHLLYQLSYSGRDGKSNDPEGWKAGRFSLTPKPEAGESHVDSRAPS
jgi:hypothetical protein